LRFTALAFDLDGTLYPNFSLFYRLVPFFLKEQRLLRAMGKARTRLREADRISGQPAVSMGGENGKGDFYDTQARIMGEILGQPADIIREKTERMIYRGWEPVFKKVTPFPHVRDVLDVFKREGIKMGLLSDFPPETKLENLKLAGYWDAILCSELTGHLKPDSTPFLELARRMGTLPENILYVGNSVPYDVDGARKAGMKAALIRTGFRKSGLNETVGSSGTVCSSGTVADFVFNDYRQLRDYVLH